MEQTQYKTRILSVQNVSLNDLETTYSTALNVLKQGDIIALPTETVYGLAANATNDHAITKIYETKQRPLFNPLILHVANITQAEKYVEFPDLAKKLANRFWPGSLTIILPKKAHNNLSELASSGLDHIAVRSPNHFFTHELIKRADWPLVAPSANPSGKVSPTHASHVLKSLNGKIEYIIDGGNCNIGIESTIISIPDNHTINILRPGGIHRKQIEQEVGFSINTQKADQTSHQTPISPGQLKSHYAPNTKIELNIPHENMPLIFKQSKNAAFITFGYTAFKPDRIPSTQLFQLSAKSCLKEAALNLFNALRTLDDQQPSKIYIAPIPNHGLGEAINDRLKRASLPED